MHLVFAVLRVIGQTSSACQPSPDTDDILPPDSIFAPFCGSMSATTTMVGLIELLVSRRPQGRRPGLVLCRLGESFRDRCWEAYITSTNGWLLDLFQIRMTFCPPTGSPSLCTSFGQPARERRPATK